MRPQQQNRRMRGRSNNNNNNNNNRRGPNPLTRTYESNGPDVKIRGSAQQIAEKYATLARDAQSSGDRVMAENYLQHAEHYNRIIAAAQAQMPIQNVQPPRSDLDDEIDEDGDDFAPSYQSNGNGGQPHAHGGQPQAQAEDGSGPQPVIEGTPAEVALNPEAAGEENEAERQPQVNGNAPHQANAEAEEGGFRRPRRPRRGRGRQNQSGDAAAEQAGADGDQPGVAESASPASDAPAFEPVES
jgi:hypothetical protein